MAKPIVKAVRKHVKSPVNMPLGDSIPVKAKSIKVNFEDAVMALAAQYKDKNCFCSYTTRKAVKVLANSPIIEKESMATAQLAVDYENSVNNQLKKEGEVADFIAKSLPWGQWKKGLEGLAIEHKGMNYIRVQASDAMIEHNPANVNWYMDGQKVEYKDIEKYLYASEKIATKETKREDAGLFQGVENAKHPLNLALKNLQDFTIGGVKVKR